MGNTNIHEGHRDHLRQRYRKEGLDNFNEINMLELLLFYCIPRIDTNPIAHHLLDYFKTLPDVLDAPMEELTKVDGVGEQAALFLSMIKDVSRYYYSRKNQTDKILTRLTDCAEYLRTCFIGAQVETVYLLGLDGKCKALGCRKLGEGSVNSAAVSVRKIVSTALNMNATSVVLAHNHPGGVAVPSDEDVATTYDIERALQSVDVVLADHIVIAGDDYVSMALSHYVDFQTDLWGNTREGAKGDKENKESNGGKDGSDGKDAKDGKGGKNGKKAAGSGKEDEDGTVSTDIGF